MKTTYYMSRMEHQPFIYKVDERVYTWSRSLNKWCLIHKDNRIMLPEEFIDDNRFTGYKEVPYEDIVLELI